MNARSFFARCGFTFCFLILLALFLAACGKTTETDPGWDESYQSPAGVENGLDAANALEIARSAMAEKDYEKATVALLHAQHGVPPADMKESMETQKTMRELQYELATAAANGDPRAQAAIEMLRRSRGR